MFIMLAASSKHLLLVKGKNVIWKSLSDNTHRIPKGYLQSFFSLEIHIKSFPPLIST